MLMRATDTNTADLSRKNNTLCNRTLSLIGVASALGCPKPGCEQGPSQLIQRGLTDTLKLEGITAHWQQIIQATQQDSAIHAVAELSQQLSEQVEKQLSQNQFFSVIGGDHSCAIGTWNGVHHARQGKPFGLIWVDAHMDSHTPHSSYSGALHGMPLACLLGFGDSELITLSSSESEPKTPALQPEHLCLLGVRSYEAEEAVLLKNLGVRIFPMAEIDARGMEVVMAEAMEIAQGAGDFGLSIDLDALDPQLAPGVSIPEPGGLTMNDLNELLRPLSKTPGFIGMEIAEFNPLFDQQQQTARLISTILAACTPNTQAQER